MQAAALLLLTACTAGEPVVGSPPCPDGQVVMEPHVQPTLKDRLHVGLKKQDQGHHIHCVYPGVIPNTEHDTLCQRIKDRLFPHKAWWPKKKEEVKEEPKKEEPIQLNEGHTRLLPSTPTPVRPTGGFLHQAISRWRWGEAPQVMYTLPGVSVENSALMTGPRSAFDGWEVKPETAVAGGVESEGQVVPAHIPTMPRKVGGESIQVMPARMQMIPRFTANGERIEMMPTPVRPAPAKLSPPRTLEIGPSLND